MKKNNSFILNTTGIEATFILSAIFISMTVWMLSILGIMSHLTGTSISTCLILSTAITLAIRSKFSIEGSGTSKNEKITVICIALIATPAILLITAPPLTWDEIAYSASLPKSYAAAKHFFYEASYGTWSAFPQNYETVTTISLILLKNTSLSIVLNIFCFTYTSYLIYKVCRLSNRPEEPSLITSIIFAISSVSISSMMLVKNDLFLTFIQSVAVYCLLKYARTNNRLYVILAGLASGTAFGTKYTDIFFFVSFSIIFLGVTTLNEKKINQFIQYVFVTTLFAFPWYLKNYYLFKNPFYPIANEFMGPNNFNMTYVRLLHEHSYALKNFNYENGDLLHYLKSMAKTNYWFNILGMIGIIASFGSDHKKNMELNILKWLAIIYFVLVFRLGFWEGRYHLILFILLSPFVCISIEKAIKNFERVGNIFKKENLWRCITVLVLLGIILNHHKNISKIYNYHTLPRAQFITLNYGEYELATFINNNLKNDGVVGFANIQPFFFIETPYCFIQFLNEAGNMSEAINKSDEFYKFIKNYNIKYLVIRFNLNDPLYDRDQAPTLLNWNDQLFLRITEFEKSDKISLVKRFKDINIYKVN